MGFMTRNKIFLCAMFIILAIIFSYTHLAKASSDDVDFSIIGPTKADPQHIIVEVHLKNNTIELKLDKDSLNDVQLIYDQVKNIINMGGPTNERK
jgi:hypothetical protein